jgi:hypothetical protein
MSTDNDSSGGQYTGVFSPQGTLAGPIATLPPRPHIDAATFSRPLARLTT